MIYRIIETEKDIDEGIAALQARCPHMRKAVELAGGPPLRRVENDFSSLCRIVVSQMLSVASAGAIWGRLEQLLPMFTPAALLDESEAALRGVGLSAGKIRTLRALAKAVEEEAVAFDRLAGLPDADIRQALTRVKGIGPWTADIYLLFCLGRADGFAPGDLALQKAAQGLMRLDERPTPKLLVELAESWRPWRGVAARQLWHYYAWRSRRDKLPV